MPMNKIKQPPFIMAVFILFITSCLPPYLNCSFEFKGYNKKYEFDISKEDLKDEIVKAYSYDKGLFVKNLGYITLTNQAVSNKYRRLPEFRLDRKNWDDFKDEIRNNTADTLKLSLGRHRSRSGLDFIAVVNGNEKKSSLTIINMEYARKRLCKKDEKYYKSKAERKIARKLIRKLK